MDAYIPSQLLNQQVAQAGGPKKLDTGDSCFISNNGTDPAYCILTSEIERDPVFEAEYDRVYQVDLLSLLKVEDGFKQLSLTLV